MSDTALPLPDQPLQLAAPRSGLARLSRHLMRGEALLATLLVVAIFLLMIAGVIGGLVRKPLSWSDELAVHLMAALAFLGASLGIAARSHMTMGLLPEMLGPLGRQWLSLVNSVLILAFMLLFCVITWRWMDPIGLLRAGSPQALANETFNFVWLDPTQTLGLRKIWFWLVMPLTAVTGTIHALAQLVEDVLTLRAGGAA